MSKIWTNKLNIVIVETHICQNTCRSTLPRLNASRGFCRSFTGTNLSHYHHRICLTSLLIMLVQQCSPADEMHSLTSVYSKFLLEIYVLITYSARIWAKFLLERYLKRNLINLQLCCSRDVLGRYLGSPHLLLCLSKTNLAEWTGC